MWGAWKSAATSASNDALGNSANSSASAAFGATFSSHSSRTAARNASCSSLGRYISAKSLTVIHCACSIQAMPPTTRMREQPLDVLNGSQSSGSSGGLSTVLATSTKARDSTDSAIAIMVSRT